MRVFTNQEMRECLSRFPELHCEDKHLEFSHSQARKILIDLRLPEPHQLVFLARRAASLFCDEQHFRSAYLWVTQIGVWDANVEGVALSVLERYRQASGENRSLNVAPGHLFRPDEFLDSVGCLVQPMLVGWDAYYIPEAADGALEYFVFVNHDSFIDIETRTDESYEKAMKVLGELKWVKIDHGQ